MSAVENQVAARRGSARAVAVASFAGRFLVIEITTYLGLLAVTFFIGRVIPIDPVLAVLGDRAPLNVVERTRREMGLDLPLVEQFYIYVKNALNGDFGTSVLTTNPVMTDIRRAFPATIELATLGTLIGSVLGVPLGVLAAVRRGSIIDQIVRIVGKADSQCFIRFRQHLYPNDAPPFVIAVGDGFFCLVRADMQHPVRVHAKKLVRS